MDKSPQIANPDGTINPLQLAMVIQRIFDRLDNIDRNVAHFSSESEGFVRKYDFEDFRKKEIAPLQKFRDEISTQLVKVSTIVGFVVSAITVILTLFWEDIKTRILGLK